jgi:hypothetical protein
MELQASPDDKVPVAGRQPTLRYPGSVVRATGAWRQRTSSYPRITAELSPPS